MRIHKGCTYNYMTHYSSLYLIYIVCYYFYNCPWNKVVCSSGAVGTGYVTVRITKMIMNGESERDSLNPLAICQSIWLISSQSQNCKNLTPIFYVFYSCHETSEKQQNMHIKTPNYVTEILVCDTW